MSLWFFAPFLALLVLLALVDFDCDMGSMMNFHDCGHMPLWLVQRLGVPAFFLAIGGLVLTLPALLLTAICETAARIKT